MEEKISEKYDNALMEKSTKDQLVDLHFFCIDLVSKLDVILAQQVMADLVWDAVLWMNTVRDIQRMDKIDNIYVKLMDIDRRLDGLHQELSARIDVIQQNFERLESNHEALDVQVDALHTRISAILVRLGIDPGVPFPSPSSIPSTPTSSISPSISPSHPPP
ncbi:hypothetical protein FXO38_04683 [Capsicum annuum]|nr:hypothetical protein FXO38_04683 [Capsicum annuum]KAF3678364.1 hypothetical protein FXO37_04403 [Capsicum annuum]